MLGMVYLVGGGPGAPGLMTVAAVECLKSADVVVYDRLADERVLRFAPPEAERIYVGKASSNHTMRQEDISRLLAKKALEGKRVVRLKGGDPFVFGRGGEEALLLSESGVPFEIVPGVTSAIAVPAYAGIPVTHRGVATSFAVVTGHEDPTKGTSSIRWEKLATGPDTLVFLMGVENLCHITQKLIENGREPKTPAAVIRWGTKSCQETLVTTLGEAADDVKNRGIRPPAVFIVGEVVKLREKIEWFKKSAARPLFGKSVLVTRARAQASDIVLRLDALGADVIEFPTIRIQDPADGYAAIDSAISRISEYDWIVLTSVNGVDRFFGRLLAAGRDVRSLASARFAAIGEATAARLRGFGILADIVPGDYRAEGVIAAMGGLVSRGTRVLIPRAAEAREILPDNLRQYGASVDVAPVYETISSDENRDSLRKLLLDGKVDFTTFASSSTVKNLVKLLGDTEPLQNTRIIAIGPVTSKTCESLGLTVAAVAKKYTIDGLIEAVLDIARDESGNMD